MRILVRVSKWAIWARRLGSFALPLTLIPVLMHRGGTISTSAFQTVETLALLLSALAVLVAIGAFIRIWITGDKGWGRAVAGLLLGLVCLVPFAVLASDYLTYPMVDDVTTDPAAPLPLVSAAPPPTASGRLAAVFPSLKTRTYPVGTAQIFNLVGALVAEHQWQVVQQSVPAQPGDSGQINAIAITLFGFRDEVSIRLTSSADGGTNVDMRSAALTRLHEPGVNGSRIAAFFAELDGRVTRLRKDQPAGAVDTTDSADDGTDQPPVPAPPPPSMRAPKR